MNFEKIDRWLLFSVIGLVIFGIAMISSVSVYGSYKLMVRVHGEEYCAPDSGVNCNNFYWRKHVTHVALSIPVFMLALFIPTRFYRKISLGFFVLAFFLLLAIFLEGIGNDYGTASRWINVPFLPSIQPSEIIKIAIVFYLAVWMEKKENEVRTLEYGFLPFVILLTVSIFPLALQPDFGSVLVIGMIAVSMFFVAGANLLHIFGGGIIASLIAWPIVLSHQYIRERFLAYLDLESAALETGFQIKQSLIAVGSGEIWGVGSGSSGQRYGWLPEVQSDTIFAAAAEELGFIRILILVGAFAVIAWRGFLIAERTNDRFSKLVATGITAWIVFQALINICVTLAMLPLTGLTLPFISYGGSSLMTLMFASGVLLHISMNQSDVNYFYKRQKVERKKYSNYQY